MATKIFVSWSGDLSNKLAEAVRQWLPSVLQFAKPYFTPSDIEKGARWGSDILSELDSSDVGIICLTKDNLQEPWILFESGALSKNFEKSKVCTLLFDVDTTDLTGPLTIFQNTKFDKRDFKKLVKTINSSGGDAKLEDSVLNDVFEMWWPKLDEKVSSILEAEKDSDEVSSRTERDILEEVLELTRLNTRKRSREIDIPSGPLLDLMENITELSMSLDIGDFEQASKFVDRLDGPLRFICRNSRSPELSKFYRQMKLRRRFIQQEIEEGEEKAE